MGDLSWSAIVAACLLVAGVALGSIGALTEDWMMMADAGVLTGAGCGAALLSLRE